MNDAPVPPYKDWQSPEMGEAVRIILDVFEGITMPQPEVDARFKRLGELVLHQPELTIAAYSAILNSSLSLPALLPVRMDKVSEVRQRLEKRIYDDINEM